MRMISRAVVVAVLMMTGCASLSGPEQPTTVYIGVDLPLSGRGQSVGTVHHNALRLRLEQVTRQRLAGETYRLALRVLDNRSDPVASAENLAALATDPEVVAVVTAGCPECLDAATPTEPVISLDPVEVLADVAGFVFQLGPSAADTADRLAQHLSRAGAATVGMVSGDDPYGRAGAERMGDAAARDGLDLVVHEPVDPAGDTIESAAQTVAGWRPEPAPPFFAPVEQTGPDAVVIWASAPRAAQVAAGLRRAGFTGPLYLDMTGADDLFLVGDAVAFDGASLVLTDTPVIDQLITASPAAAARHDWFTAYLSRYGTYHLHASWAADAVTVLATALARAGTTDPVVLRDKLEDTRVDGFTGQIRFTPASHAGLHPSSLTLLRAAGGRWYPQT